MEGSQLRFRSYAHTHASTRSRSLLLGDLFSSKHPGENVSTDYELTIWEETLLRDKVPSNGEQRKLSGIKITNSSCKNTGVLDRIKIIGDGKAVTGGDLFDLMFTIAVECCPLNGIMRIWRPVELEGFGLVTYYQNAACNGLFVISAVFPTCQMIMDQPSCLTGRQMTRLPNWLVDLGVST